METTVNLVLSIANLLFLAYNIWNNVSNRIKDKMSAELVFHVFWRDFGACYLVIENKGNSFAENISISEPGNLSGIFEGIQSQIPERIAPGCCALLLFPDHKRIPNESCVSFSWKDKHKKINQKLVFLYFNLSEKNNIKPEWLH